MAKTTTDITKETEPDFSNLADDKAFENMPVQEETVEEEVSEIEVPPVKEVIETTDTDTKEKVEETEETNQEEETYDYNGLLAYEIEHGLVKGDIPDDMEDLSEDDYLKMKTQMVETDVNTKVEDGIETVLKEIDEQYNGALSHLIQGGNLADFGKVHTMGYSNIDEVDLRDNVAKQEYVLREHYKTHTKFSDTRIEKMITKLKDIEDLEDTALDVLPELKQYEINKKAELVEQTKIQKENDEAQTLKQMKSMISAVDSTKEFLGVPITGRLKSSIVKDVENKATMAKINKDFDKYLPILTILDRIGVLDGKDATLKKHFNSKATKVVNSKIKGKSIPFKGKKVKGHTEVEDRSMMISNEWWK